MRHALLAAALLAAPFTVPADTGPNWRAVVSERLEAASRHRDEGEAKRAMLEESAQVMGKGWAPDQGPSPVDVLRYDLDLSLDPGRELVDGVVEVELAAAVDDLTTFELDADSGLRILGTALVEDLRFPHDAGTSLPFAHHGDRLQVQLHRALDQGERVRVLVGYQGHGERGSYGLHWDELGDGTPLIWTLSQPLGARLWWPCNDRPDDKAFTSLAVTAPSGLVAASNGVEVGRVDNGDGTATTRFASRYPISTYLVVLNLTTYVYSERPYTSLDGTTTMPVAVYAYPSNAAQAEAALADTPDMIAAFAQRFGEYPFLEERYGNCLTPFGGGMEHQTLCSYGAGVLGLDWLNAHEVSHQWWGDWVTYDDWKEIWLAEGLASYSEVLWVEHNAPDQVVPYLRSQDALGYFTGPLYDNEVQFSNTVYDKASRVFHMLRNLVGNDAFFEALRMWRSAHGGASATTADLRAAMETASRMELGWFFEQWVYGSSRPHLQYAWEVVSGPAVRLTVRQVQTNVPPFRLPLDVRVTTTTGNEDFQVWVEGSSEQTFELPVSATPTSLAVDPDSVLLADMGPASAPDLEPGPEYPGPILVGGVVRGAPVRHTLEVTNVGGENLVIFEAFFYYGGQMSVVGPAQLPLALAPGQSAPIEIEFEPRTLGFGADYLVVVSNDPSRDGITLFEIWTGAGLSLDPMVLLADRIDFGQVPVAATGRAYFDIVNYGAADLEFSLAFSGEEMALGSATSGTVPAGELFRVWMTLTPSSVGPRSGAVVVTTNDSLTPTHTVTLAGEGVAAPHLVFDPPALAFGIAGAGQDALLYLRNDGGEDLEVSSLEVASGPFELAESWELPVTLSAGSSRELRLRFTGAATGSARGRLRVESDDPSAPVAHVPLQALVDDGGLDERAFAAAARTPGLGGAFWRTDTVFVNPTADNLALDVRLLTGAGGDDPQPDLTLSVPAGQLRAVPDVVSAMGLTGVGGVGLVASAPGLVAVSRTYAGEDGDSYGQHIPAVAEGDALAGGAEYLLAGLASGDGFHTNLGVLNLSPAPLTVTFALAGPDGDDLGTAAVTAPAHGFDQANDVFAALTAAAVRGGTAVVTTADPATRFLAYASVVDDGSHDPTFIPATAVVDTAALHAMVPAVASNPGLGGTMWRSELTLANRGSETAAVTLTLHPRDDGTPATTEVEVPPLAALHLDDVVGSTLAASGSGWLEATSTSGDLLLSSRTFNDDPAGTYGQYVPAVAMADLVGAGETVVLAGLTSRDGFRSNLGIASAADVETQVTLRVVAENGALVGELEVTLPPQSLVQLDRVLAASFGHTGLAWAALSSDDPAAAFAAYVSVVDEGTGDPVFIPAVRLTTGR